ncbi:TetR/AcrR family transcriptional regulator [Georgenia sp. TF02-10]|uniref:TetR/AcrR family transcriptional regulator n=1 Tax=Georgenia sp. TF02-10 TaxID=2917725 RepID=UPI001FA7429F|nr:TetR/AcrR family transcriptional regulator [Georgenia sp. TF02-10]UNX53670.1 TetR/AcrR family transcriptional regulator [Georgenia sp. TF02-10]
MSQESNAGPGTMDRSSTDHTTTAGPLAVGAPSTTTERGSAGGPHGQITTDGPVLAQPTRRGPGRPRHADTEERAYRAVLELFGRKGWSGLSLDGVATHAGIGKSSIYLRWKDKRDLLLDAVRDLDRRHRFPEPGPEGIREYLIAHARARADIYLSEYGPAMVHLFSGALVNPEAFAEIRQEEIAKGMAGLSHRIERAIADGELPPETSAWHLLDAIEGAVFVHIFVSSAGEREEAAEGIEDYVTELVDIQLRGIRGGE